MTVFYTVLIVVGLLVVGAGLVGLVDAAAERVHPLPPAIPLVPFDACEDDQPTLGVPVGAARRAVAEADRLAAAAPVRGSVTVVDPSRAGWLFADRRPAGVPEPGAQWVTVR